MKQVSKKKPVVKKRTVKKAVRIHPKYGTSKLEEDFAKDFLDKLGFKYIYQFEAKDIGRFYDFAVECPNGNGVNGGSSIILLEIDGGWYHSDPRIVKEKEKNPMQKHNARVDKQKDEWALMRGIPIMRIWEKDIRENPSEVIGRLKERFYLTEQKNKIIGEKNKRHKNVIK
jgi:hypothetical protein